MIYKHHLLLGLLLSGSYLSTLQGMEYIEPNPGEEIVLDRNAAEAYPTLQLLPSFIQQGFVQWQEDPENPGMSRIDLPFLLNKTGKKMQTITRLQSRFLTKFKKMTLPCVINEQDLKILKSLGFMEFFELSLTKKSEFVLNHHSLLPVKKSDNNTKKLPQKRKHKNTEWHAQEINENGELITIAKLPLLLYRERKNIFKKPRQQQLLKQFKNAQLPYIITNAEKETFDSLQFGSILTTQKTDVGWEISPRASLPTKIINMD